MRNDFDRLIKHPDQFGIELADAESSAEELLLAGEVPFSQNDDYALLNRLSREREVEDRRRLFKNVTAMLASVMSGYGAYRGWDDFVQFVRRTWGNLPAEVRPSKEDLEKQAATLEKKEAEIDAGQYAGLEEQQAEAGPIPLPENGDSIEEGP